jgi:YfiH family protein
MSEWATALAEVPVPGPVPRYEIPGWRERFGVVAGITGRGANPGTGFDLGLSTREPVGDVMDRWREFRCAEPGFDAFVMGYQVHGSVIAEHEGAQGWTLLDGIDGHVTRERGTLLLVSAADCIPIYLVAPKGRVIALLHAGWRGTSDGILSRGIERLASFGAASAADIVMHCGVGICGTCYEVGREVMDACGVAAPGSGPWHLDLRARLAAEARRLGLAQVTTSSWCSAHDRRAFFSHRASGGADGRMVAYLGLL